MAKWKVAGINFDHFHMGDLLREAFNHPDAEIVGICDAKPVRMRGAKVAVHPLDHRERRGVAFDFLGLGRAALGVQVMALEVDDVVGNER